MTRHALFLIVAALLLCGGVTSARADDAPPPPPVKKPHPGPCKVLTRCVGECGQIPTSAVTLETYDWGKNGLLKSVEVVSMNSYRGPHAPTSVDVYRSIETWQHDARGLLVGIERDSDADGTVDAKLIFSYPPEVKSPPDVRGPARDYYAHAQPWLRFRPSRVSHDNKRDGVVDSISYFTYNAEGRLLNERHDGDADGTAEFVVDHTIEASGEYETWSSHNAPDSDEMCVTHPKITRDGEGRIIRAQQSSNICDSELDITYHYDAMGNLSERLIDEGADGTPDAIEVYDYRCWSAP